MDGDRFLELIEETGFGKKLPNAVYLHNSALSQIHQELQSFVSVIEKAVKCEAWNVLKLSRNEFRLSLLNYPHFETNPYPSLKKSLSVDLVKLSTEERDYSDQTNPPILHRKELLVLEDHPEFENFRQITLEGENAGLYENTAIIGHKQSWEFLIKQKGYELVDGRLFRASSFSDLTINREKTAISRYQLSSPFVAAAKLNLLSGHYSVMDYGCGRGDDLSILEHEGIDAIGWDPNFRPGGVCEPRDIVNLGFVINVIEDRKERDEAVQKAFGLAKKALLVSAMVANEQHIARFKPFKDGVITSRNTFQKYYTQQDLSEYLNDLCGVGPMPLATGVFAIFKDEQLELECLNQRFRRRSRLGGARVKKRSQKEANQELFDAEEFAFTKLWAAALELGRFPTRSETEYYEPILARGVGVKKIQSLLLQFFDSEELDIAAHQTMEDLILAQAMSKFQGRTYFNDFSDSQRHEIRHFFSNFTSLKQNADDLLAELVDPELLIGDVTSIREQGIPHFESHEEHQITLHKDALERLPLRLRAYVECAKTLYGELESIQLVKLHLASGKVSFLGYENFDAEPLPRLIERIKVDLWNQRVRFYDYVDDFVPPFLYWKSKLIPETFPHYQKQKTFDENLDLLGGAPDDPNFGFGADALRTHLKERNRKIQGFRFYKIDPSLS